MPADPAFEEQRNRSLRASIKDGFAYSIMQGFGERHIQPFAKFVGVSDPVFGLLTSLQWLAAGIFQVVGANVVDGAGRRKPYILGGAFVQALSWGVLLLALFVVPPWNVVLVIFSQIVYLGSLHFTLPPWQSVMGELVPDDRRGRYFGLRNFLCGAGQLATFTGAAILLDHLRARDLEREGFLLFFVLALLCRLLSTWYLTRMHEPKYVVAQADRFTLLEFVRRMPHGNFGRFVIYVTVLFFGITIAVPFIGLFMLKDLRFSYTEFMIAGNLQLLTLFCTMPFWGRLGDRRGNKLVLAVGGIGLGLVPVLWMASTATAWVFFVQAVDGAATAAVQIATGNYLLDTVTPPKRARCTAYYNLFVGAGIAAGAGLGGLLSWAVPADASVRPFTVLLLCSAVVRWAACLLLLPTFADLRVNGAPVPAPELEKATS